MTGADTNRWRPVMLDGEPGSSAEAARWSAREVFDRWIRRFLWLGLTRTSARLRNVTGSEGPIRARARLESARIEEKYRYQQEISLNPSSEISCKPTGRIKLVLPYDGEKCFTRQAYKDMAQARRLGADPDGDVLIGFLALTGYDNTDLGALLDLDENYGSVPIQVQLPPKPGPREADPLLADRSACVVSHDYRPQPRIGEPVPLHIDIGLHDPDTAEIPLLPEAVSERLHITRQVDFK